jgi:hypothetical protein
MMMGSETEFAILGGWSLAKANAIQAAIRRRHISLPAAGDGVFVESAARALVDQCKHNEWSTPECHTPVQVVVYELAGRRVMAEAASEVGLSLLCTNVHGATGNSWGAHENYECRRALSALALEYLYVHLVTRLVFSGAGGVDPSAPGVRLVLSPRATRVVMRFNRQGSLPRSFVFAKPNHYGRRYRLHVFAGESNLSRRATFLKWAATALVVRLLDLGQLPSFAPLVSPIRAIRTINRDTSLSGRLPFADGRRATALETQRRLACWVEGFLPRLPVWAFDAVHEWHAVLDDLATMSPRAQRSLDWTVYLRLLRAQLSKEGIGEEEIRLLTQAAAECGRTSLLASDSVRLERARTVADDLYVQLHIIDPESLYAQLERAGIASGGMSGVTDAAVERAMRQPPSGRASNRARLIGLLQPRRSAVRMSWHEVVDVERGTTTPIPTR